MVLGRTTNQLKDGTKRVLEYYVCGRWKNKGTAACRLNGVRIDYAAIQKQLSLIEGKKNKVLDLYEEGMIGKADFKKLFYSLDEEREQLERHLEPLIQHQSESIN